jgi:hypothetical protein
LDVESNQTFTTNAHYFLSYKDKFATYYKSVRKDRGGGSALAQGFAKGLNSNTPFSKYMGEVISSLAKMGLSIQPEDLGKLINSDTEEDIVGIMAEVRAYYQGM